MEKVLNKFNVELKIGDKIIITKNKLGSKVLANVEKHEVIIITGFSDDGKIMYHNQSLALPVNSEIYRKLNIK
jgi:hypothetical protein